MVVENLTAISIFKALLPTLKLASKYASNIQKQIQAQPEKEQYGDNFYATALTDADLTIQTAVELSLLAQFPDIHFFGEEYEKSYNTKYFKNINLGDELLITLDPIDGTRFYLDGLDGFSIILTVIKNKSYQGVLILQPIRKCYYYALKGEGAFVANIDDNLEQSQPLTLQPPLSNRVYLSFALANLRNKLGDEFEAWCSATDYSLDQKPAEYFDLFSGKLAGIILGHGNLIDSAAIAFMAEEAGAIVTNYQGETWQPFSEVKNMRIPGLIISGDREIHQKLVHKLQKLD